MNRKRTPPDIETAVLMKCARRCALCFFLDRDLSEKHGQIAHVDQDPLNFTEDNLAFLCVKHHSLYDSKTSQHKNYTADEVKKMRADLHDAIGRHEHATINTVLLPSAAEVREARRAESAPPLVMEQRFLDFCFVWPHPAGLNGGPVFLARKHWQDKDPSTPLFSIQNFDQSPVLDVRVVFELDDDNPDLSVPSEWQAHGISASEFPVPSLRYQHPRGTGVALPLYRRWSCELPNLSPGLPREIELPEPIANRLFLRGLQRWTSRGQGKSEELTLWARITCHSLDGEQNKAAFRWGVNPFSHGQTNPIIIYGHCRALPLRAGPPEPAIV